MKIEIRKELVEILYVDDRLTIKQVANTLGISVSSVNRLLKKFDIHRKE